MAEHADYLMVYGTLRPSFTNPFAQYLHRCCRYVGEGSFPGLLFDLGAYPGAIYRPDQTGFVWGSVFALNSLSATVLPRLDEYEGVGVGFDWPTEYVRTVIPVHCNGETLSCWVYLYNLPVGGLPVIQSGNYLNPSDHRLNRPCS